MMPVRDILLYPHPTLRAPCQRVEVFDETLHTLLDDMAQTMYTARGVGLAAPQVGVSLQVVVIDTQREEDSTLIELINPCILSHQGEPVVGEEGCLSFPDIYAPVSRYPYVKVQACHRDGEVYEIEGEGFLAVVLQHEIDHLHGKLFLDFVNRFRQDQIRKQMKKKYAKGEWFWTPKPKLK